MSDKWNKVSDVRAFLADKGQKKTGPHQLSKRILNWAYCSRCGLVALKNKATRSALRKPCVTYE